LERVPEEGDAGERSVTAEEAEEEAIVIGLHPIECAAE
jgi:hypothetical protein